MAWNTIQNSDEIEHRDKNSEADQEYRSTTPSSHVKPGIKSAFAFGYQIVRDDLGMKEAELIEWH